MAGLDVRDRLVVQRQMLNKRLGLDVAGNLQLGIDKELFSDEDLLTGMKKEMNMEQDAVIFKIFLQDCARNVIQKG